MKTLVTLSSVLAALFGLTSAAPYYSGNGTLSSNYSISLKTSTPSYTATYTVDSSYTPAVLNFQLSVTGFDTSTWGTNAVAGNGMFVGIGLATKEMSNADIVICKYEFKNLASDAFVCSDTKTDSKDIFTTDSSQDVYNVSTVSPTSYTRTSTTSSSTNFVVKFTRPMITNDTSNDSQLSNQTYDIIWALGYIVSNSSVQHVANNYGSAKLNLTMAPYYVTGSSAYKTAVSIFTLVAAILFLNF